MALAGSRPVYGFRGIDYGRLALRSDAGLNSTTMSAATATEAKVDRTQDYRKTER